MEEQILGMPVEVMIIIIMGFVAALVSFLVAMAVSMGNGEGAAAAAKTAAEEALKNMLENEEWIETLEYQIDESIPEDAQKVGIAMLHMLDRFAAQTNTELDDYMVAILLGLMGDGVSAPPSE